MDTVEKKPKSTTDRRDYMKQYYASHKEHINNLNVTNFRNKRNLIKENDRNQLLSEINDGKYEELPIKKIIKYKIKFVDKKFI